MPTNSASSSTMQLQMLWMCITAGVQDKRQMKAAKGWDLCACVCMCVCMCSSCPGLLINDIVLFILTSGQVGPPSWSLSSRGPTLAFLWPSLHTRNPLGQGHLPAQSDPSTQDPGILSLNSIKSISRAQVVHFPGWAFSWWWGAAIVDILCLVGGQGMDVCWGSFMKPVCSSWGVHMCANCRVGQSKGWGLMTLPHCHNVELWGVWGF